MIMHEPTPLRPHAGRRLVFTLVAIFVAGLVGAWASPAVADVFNKTDHDTYEYSLLLEKGARYINARNYKRAFETYEKALNHESQEVDLYYNLVIVGEALEKWSSVVLYAQAYMNLMQGEGGAEEREIKGKQARAFKEAGKSASFSVTCAPEAELVLVDGAYFARKGIEGATLPEGSYEVSCYRKDYHPGKQTIKISVEAPTTWKVQMEEIIYYGEIALKTKSEGVKVYVDDKLVGETPLKEALKVQANREHVLRLEKKGHDTWMRAIEVKKNKRHHVDAMLEVSPGDEDDTAW
jgi:tetratricopeptide (TPR) repeat protein